MLNKILVIVLVIIANNLYAQTLKITYSETKDPKEILESIENPSIRKMVMEKMSKPITYEFVSCNGVSLYKKVDNNSQGEYYVYKNHLDSTIVEQTNFFMKDFLIEEKMKKQEWEIHEETKTIGGFNCKKATLGEKVIVWFTNELPISDGPKSFYGLSGLILRVESGILTMEATKMELLEENLEIVPPTKGKKMSRKDFDKFRKDKIGDMKNGNSGVRVMRM